ncbi:N-acetylmuramoyl-L-alanine amidase [Pectinatus sottacetonis]|uniref:N-acetylmuramoyl-L-alanine amidase n=1 Tax=Pectinatus sottacetonis TaxID=1002795 RepID=UPI0018C6DFFE|nr:N-acetylmuramoyl-L-alanine amidase [Pectinatus sottacetonis]
MPKSLQIFTIAILLLIFGISSSTVALANKSYAKSSLAKIKDLRISITDNKLRLVADADKEVDYKSFGLSAPDRIVIDLQGAYLTPSVKKVYPVANKIIKDIRIAQFSPDTVRIVIKTSLKKDNYDVFSLTSGNIPYRVVMDFDNKKTASIRHTTSSNKHIVSSNTTPLAVTTKNHTDIFKTTGLKGKIIAIDPGHGGNDSGAIGPSGAMEKTTTLSIGLKLKKLLENAGAVVVMTRTTDTSVAAPTASDVEELQKRCDVADNANADIFISIHNDSFTDSSTNGTSSYYYAKGSGLSKQLANYIRLGVINAIHTPDRGTRSCNFYVVKHTKMPASLIEVAFISNPTEEKLLTSQSGDEKIAEGIFSGISKFFSPATS